MIAYLLSFVLCSGLLLAAYYVLLKNKAMYRFNRAYLLTAVAFSLTVPLIHLNNSATVLKSELTFTDQLIPAQMIAQPKVVTNEVNNHPEAFNYKYYVCLLGYSLVTALLLFRFARNLYCIRQMVMQSVIINEQSARLVLIPKRLTPHSFFNCIFVNKEEYTSNRIDAMVLGHEMAHVRQWHSADIVIIELVQAVFWFNPFIVLYRKAIQLNHEFLADETALNTYPDVIGYQHLLVAMANNSSGLTMASQFNYSVTRDRLIMMTRRTPVLTGWISKLAIVFIALLAVVLFSSAVKEIKQSVPAMMPMAYEIVDLKTVSHGDTIRLVSCAKMPIVPFPHTQNGISPARLVLYHSIENKYLPSSNLSSLATLKAVKSRITSSDKDQLITLFKQMSLSQQRTQHITFTYPPKPVSPITPTETDFNSWKSGHIYGVWLNDKHIQNNELNNHTAKNIVQLYIGKLTINTSHYKEYKYQVNLMTKDKYDAYYKMMTNIQYKSLMGITEIESATKKGR